MPQLDVMVDSVPAGANVYVTAIVDVAGTVAANNLMSVFNPAGSTKTHVALGFIAQCYTATNSTATSSLTSTRITSSSGGSLLAASSVGRFLTTYPDPQCQVRTGNPTVVTSGPALLGIAPVETSAGGTVNTVVAPTPGASFTLLPGQGLVFGTAAGSAMQLWNIQYVWMEF